MKLSDRYMAVRKELQNGLCYLCGGVLIRRPQKCERHWRETIEHVTPVGRGGFDNFSNKLLAHAICNEHKGNRMPRPCETFYLHVVNSITLGDRWKPQRTEPERRASQTNTSMTHR